MPSPKKGEEVAVPMITTNDFENGMIIEVEGELFQIVEFQHVKPGKGQAFVRTRLKKLGTGEMLNRVFPADREIMQADVERRKVIFLYREGEEFVFMDEDYEEIRVPEEAVGKARDYIVPDVEASVLVYEGKVVGVEPPIFVDLKVVETEPGVRGDTKSRGSKPAKLETGLVVQVPLFVNEGDVVRVDTRTSEYEERVGEA